MPPVALGVVAYSAGPYPLSHHGLGEIAVILFFGIVPVNMTYFLMCDAWTSEVLLASLSMGLMGANVLIVNNYRDIDDDHQVGKSTLCVKLGRPTMAAVYLIDGLIAIALMAETWIKLGGAWLLIPVLYLCLHFRLWSDIRHRDGAALNPMLGATAMAMLAYALSFLICAIIVTH